jgi:hypothetical protein
MEMDYRKAFHLCQSKSGIQKSTPFKYLIIRYGRKYIKNLDT